MTERQIELVASTWDFFILRAEDAGIVFYDKLFELDPSLRELFGDDIKLQSEKLISTITFAVHKLDCLHEIIRDVQALGMRHRGYGVKEEHYETVCKALLWTLEINLRDSWNSEVSDAWKTLYGILSKTMIDAANGQ